MNYKKNGSAILIVIIISSVIMLHYITSWHSTSLIADLVYKKYHYEKDFRLTQSLLNYGLLLCKNKFDVFMSKKDANINTFVLYKGNWPMHSQNNMGTLIININDEELTLNALISKKDKNFKISATLCKKEATIIGQNDYDKNKNLCNIFITKIEIN